MLRRPPTCRNERLLRAGCRGEVRGRRGMRLRTSVGDADVEEIYVLRVTFANLFAAEVIQLESARMGVASHFAGKDPTVRATYRRLIDDARTLGPVTEERTSIDNSPA